MNTPENTMLQITFWTTDYIESIPNGPDYRDTCLNLIRRNIADKIKKESSIIIYPEDDCHASSMSIYLKYLFLSSKKNHFIIISNSSMVLSCLRLLHMKGLLNLTIKVLGEDVDDTGDTIVDVTTIQVDGVGTLSDWPDGLFQEEYDIIKQLKKEKLKKLV